MSAPLIWSTTPSDNQTIDPAAQWPEGQPASSLNNSARGMMARLAMARDDAVGVLLASVNGLNGYTLTTNQGLIDPASTQGGGAAKIGRPFVIRVVLPPMPTAIAISAPSIAIDGAAAVPLTRRDGSPLADGDLTGVPVEILGDQVVSGACTRVRILNLLPSDVRTLVPPTLGTPIGIIAPFASQFVPTGYLRCDGSALLRANYPTLWGFAQGSGMLVTEANWQGNQGFYTGCFSTGDGSTSFRLPALNGVFIRGQDLGRGLDPNRQLGTLQYDALKSHTHALTGGGFVFQLYGSGPNITLATGNEQPNPGARAASIANTGDVETRPINVAYPYLIRAY